MHRQYATAPFKAHIMLILFLVFVLNCISVNVVLGFPFASTGSQSICFDTDPSRYVNVSNVPFRGSATVGRSSLLPTTWTGQTSLCLKSVPGSVNALTFFLSLNRVVDRSDIEDSEYGLGYFGKASSQCFPTTGGLLVSLVGTGFGVYDLSPLSKFGLGKILSRQQPMLLSTYADRTIIPFTTWSSDSSVWFSSAIGNGRGLWVATGETHAQILVLKLGLITTSATSMFTFASPAVLPSVQHELSTGSMVCVIGSSFSMWNDQPKVAFTAGSGAFMSRWISDSSIQAKIFSSIFNRSSAVVVSVASQVGRHPVSWYVSINASFSSVLVPSTGSKTSHILGLGFGLNQHSAASKTSQSAPELTQWISDSDVRIKMVPFQRNVFGLLLTVNQFSGQSSTHWEVLVHSVRNFVHEAPFPSSGSNFLSLNLFSLGILDQSSTCRLGAASLSSCASSIWRSDSSLVGRFNSGLLNNFSVFVSVNSFVASASGTLAPNFTNASIFPLCIPMSGSQSQFIFASGIEISDASVRTRLMNTDCQISAWKSDSGLICKTPDISKLARLNDSVFISVPFYGAKSIGYSDAKILVRAHSVAINNSFLSSSTGSQGVTITSNLNAKLDMSIQHRLGNSETRASIWLSHSSMVLKLSHGLGANLSVRLSSQSLFCAQNNDGMTSMSYMSPKFNNTVVVQKSIVSSGSSIHQIIGMGLGLAASSSSVRLQSITTSSLELTNWIADSSLSCKVPAFLFSNNSLTISCQKLLSNSVPMSLGNENVNVTSFIANHSTNAQTGGDLILLIFNSFGTFPVSSRARISWTSSDMSLWLSESSFTCKKSSRARSNLQHVIISLNQLLSVIGTFQEDSGKTVLAFTHISAIPSSASSIATIIGSFGVFHSPKIKLVPSSCLVSMWMSSSSLRCKVPSGICSSWTVVSSIFLISSSSFLASRVNWSDIPFQSNTSLITTGSVFVPIVGKFSAHDSSMKLKFEHSSCSSSRWISDSQLYSKYMSGYGRLSVVHISVVMSVRPGYFLSSGYNVSSRPFQNLTPGNNTASPNVVSTGSVINQLVLTNGLGILSCSSQFRLHASGAETTSWVSDSMLLVKICYGTNSNVILTLTIAMQTSEYSTSIKASLNSLFSVEKALQPATGASSLEISGLNLDVCRGSIRVRLGVSASALSVWISSSSLLARKLPDTVFLTPISMSSNSVVAKAVIVFGYLRPNIFLNSESILSTSDSLISVSGVFSGEFGQTCALRVSMTSSAGTRWISSSALTAMSTSGPGVSTIFILSYSDFKINLTSNISFEKPLLSIFNSQNYDIFTASGAAIVSVSGSYLGTFAASANGRISSSASGATSWISSSSIRMRLCGASHFNAPIVLSVSCSKSTSKHILCSRSSVCGPSVSNVSSMTFMTSGSVVIGAIGKNLMTNHHSPCIRFSFSSSLTSLWTSDSSVQAKSASSIFGIKYSIDVSILGSRTTGNFSNISVNFTNISSISSYISPTTGSISITMFGYGFGTSWMSSSIQVGFLSPQVMWSSDSSVACKLKAFVSSSVRAAWNGAIVSSPEFLFDSMVASALSKYNSPTVQSDARIYVFGSFFGLQDPTMAVTIDSQKLATQWVSESCVVAAPVLGTGQNLTVAMFSRYADGNPVTLKFSYDTLAIGDGSDSLVPTIGGEVNIFGTNFGTGTLPLPSASIGLTACTQVSRPVMDFIHCSVQSGTGRGLSICLYRSAEIYCRHNSFSYRAPFVSDSKSFDLVLPATGKSSLTVFGRDFGVFGYSPIVRLARKNEMATRAMSSVWKSTTCIQSLTSRAIGDQIAVFTSVSQQSSNLILYTVSNPLFPALHSSISAPATSSFQLQLSAMNLGLSGQSIRSNFLMTSSEASIWTSESFLMVKTIGRGLFDDVSSIVSVQRNINNRTKTIDPILSVSILSFTIQTDSTKSSSGSMIVTTFGRRLHSIDASPMARFIRSAMETSLWVSDSAVVSKASSWILSGLSHILLVSSNKKTSGILVRTIMEYDILELSQSIDVAGFSKVNFTNLIQSTGSTPLVLLGSSFGQTDSSLVIKFLSTSFTSTAWRSQSSIICKVFMFSSRKHGSAAVTLNNNLGLLFTPSDYSFQVPLVPSLSLYFPSTGSQTTPRLFSAIGSFDQTIRIRSQMSAQTSSQWVSDTSMISKISSGVGHANYLRISIDSVIFSVGWSSSYSIPSLTASFAVNLSSSGNLQITCYGSSFGDYFSSSRAQYFHSSVQSTSWTSDSSMNFKISSFARNSLPSAMVSLDRQIGVFRFDHDHFIYDLAIHRLNNSLPSTGSITLSLTGSGMLEVGMTNRASLRRSACSLSLWKSASGMVCKIPSFSHSSLEAVISVDQKRMFFTNTSIILGGVSWANSSFEFPTTGSIVLLSARGLGNFDISAKVSLSTSCESTFWRADSSMMCKTSQSEAKYLEMTATFAARKVFSEMVFRCAPSISAVHPSYTPSTGLHVLTLSGSGFLFHNLTFSPIQIGSTLLRSSVFVSDSSLLTTTPAGEGLVNIYFLKNSAPAGSVAYSFGKIYGISAALSDDRTGQSAQLQLNFSSSQTIEKFGRVFIYLPSQIQLQNQSTVDWISGIFQGSGQLSLSQNFVQFQSQQIIPSAKFAIIIRNIALSSTAVPVNPVLVRSSMESNITIDTSIFNFNFSIIPSNASEFTVKHSILYAGSVINVSVFLKTFNLVEKGDIFVIKFPIFGASFISTSFYSAVDLSLLDRGTDSFKISVLSAGLASYSFFISGIVLQPFSGQMSAFSGSHYSYLSILKEYWVATDNVSIQPGKLQNVMMHFSNHTIGSTMNVEISFIPANSISENSIVVLEFVGNDVIFTHEAYLGSLKLLSFYDGDRKIAIQIPIPVVLNSNVSITFKNVFITLGPSRSTSAVFTSQAFNPSWNTSASYQPIVIDTGASNPIVLMAPNFIIGTKFSSLQMRAQVYLNMTIHIPNILPKSGSLEIIISNHFNFSDTNISVLSNCFEYEWSSAILFGSKAILSIRSAHLSAFQNCFINVGPVRTPGFPGYNGRVSLVIRSQDGIFAYGESAIEFFFVSFISAKISGNCSVSLSWNNTVLVDLPESWAISCLACTETYRQKTYAPHLRFYHYDNMPCMSGIEFVFHLREIDVNGTAVIPKIFDNLDAFEVNQWSVKLTLVTLPSAPKITNLNQTLSRRATFNWEPRAECHEMTVAHCPVASSLISVTSLCHPSPDIFVTSSMFFDVYFEFSTNYTVCVSFVNAAGTSLPECFSQFIEQSYPNGASISFVEIPTNIRAGTFFTPAVTVRLHSPISDSLGNFTVFSNFIVNETKSFTASYRSCAVTSEDGLAVFFNMSFAPVGTATMDVFLSKSQTSRSPKFQITNGVAAKISLFDIPKIIVAAIDFPQNLLAEVTDKVENVIEDIHFNARLTFTSASDSNKSLASFFASSNGGVALFKNVSISEVGDYFGQVHILNFKSSLFDVTVMSGASILIRAEMQPSDSQGGEIFTPLQPLLTLRDRGNNIAIDYFDYVTTSFDFASQENARILGVSEKFSYLGVCRFYDMAIDLAGQYRLKFSAVGLIPAISRLIVVVVGAPFKLAILKQPADTYAGNEIVDFASVKVVDRGTNLVNSSNSTVRAELKGFHTNVPLLQFSACTSGVASFSNMHIQTNGTAYFIAFSASGLLSTNSQLFAIVPGPAAFIRILSSPQYGLGGLFFEPRVQLFSSDFWGNELHSGYANGPDRTSFIHIQNCSYTACSDKLLGNRSSNFYNGVARFENSAISLVGWYVLTFSIENISVSQNITVYNSNASFLTVEREPSLCFGGEKCKFQPIVTIRDIATNVAEVHASSLAVVIFANQSSAVSWRFLGSSAKFSQGVAVFKDFGFDKIGTYLVNFTARDIVPCSIYVHVVAGAANSFRLTQIPGLNASGGSSLDIQPILTFYDLGFNIANVSNSTTHVVLLFANNVEVSLASGNLIGNYTVTSEGPVVIFKNIGIRAAALGYKLQFSCSLVPNVLHFPIDVYPGFAHSMQILNHSTEAFGAQMFPSQPVVLLLDLGGNVAANNHDDVIVSMIFTTNARSRILGTRSVPAVSGVCRFFDLAVDLIGTHVLAYAVKDIIAATSPNITIFSGPSANLRMVTQPSDISGGSQFHPLVSVEILDLGGNLVANNNSKINVSLFQQLGSAKLLGNLTSFSLDGVATFNNITVDKIGQNYSFLFGFESLTVMSVYFAVTVGDLKSVTTLIAPSGGIVGRCMLPHPAFGLFDAGWNQVYSAAYTAVARTSPDSKHLLRFQNSSSNGAFVFSCINSTVSGLLYLKLFVSPGELVFQSSNFTIVHGSSHHLVSYRFPESAICGVQFSVQPVIRIADAFQNYVFFESAPAISVEASLRNSINGESLLFGTIMQDITSDGSANFHALYIDLYTSTDWRIVFTANDSSIIKLTSPGIQMIFGDSKTLRIPREIISAQSRRNIQPYCVSVLDTGGNIKRDYLGFILVNISKLFTHEMIPIRNLDFLSDSFKVNSSFGIACFSFACPVTAIFSLVFRLQNEPNISIETPLFMSSECEVQNITFASQSIQNVGGGSTLVPFPKIKINGEGCASSGESIFNMDAFIIYANQSVPKVSGFKGNSTLHAINGIVEFNNIRIDLSDGPYAIKFVFGTFTVQSNLFYVVVGPSAIMSVVQQPSLMNTAGESFVVQPTVGFFDVGMNLNKTMQFLVTVNLSGPHNLSQLAGNVTVFSSEGLAAFHDLTLNLAPQNWTLVFSCAGFISVTSTPFLTKIGHPFQLILSNNSQPLNATACMFFPVQPLLTIIDKGGNTVPTGAGEYSQEYLHTSLKFLGNHTSLYEWVAVPSNSGIFQLANLTYCNRGFNFVLVFSLVNSQILPIISRSFHIPVGIAMTLRVIQDPSDVIAGKIMHPFIGVASQFNDGSFAPDANVMYVNLISNSSNNSTRVDYLNMRTGFSELSSFVWNITGTFYFAFDLNGLKATSRTFEIQHGIPQMMLIRTQPSESIAAQIMSPSPELLILDMHGNVATLNGILIMASLVIPGNSSILQPLPSLKGARICNSTLGLCSFSDLSINKAHSAYQILFSSINFTFSMYSIEFKVKYGAPVRMIMLSEPPSFVIAGDTLPLPPQVALVDIGDNIAESGSYRITAKSNISYALIISNFTSLGVASFFGITVFSAGDYKIDFSSEGFATMSSSILTVLPGSVFQIVFESVANGSSVERLFSKEHYPIVTLRDKGHNIVNSSQAITVFLNSSNNASLRGNLTVLARFGVAFFDNIYLEKNGVNYQLLASCNDSGAFLFAKSSLFDVRPGPPSVIKIFGSLGLNVDGSKSTFFFTSRLIPSVCVQITDNVGNALNNITVEIFSKGTSSTVLAGNLAATSDIDGVACFDNLVLKGVHSASITFMFLTKLNHSDASFAISGISVLPQLDIEALLDGNFIVFSSTINVPSSYRATTLPSIFGEMTLESFGVGANCLWISENQFVVNLGASPSFHIDQPIRFGPKFLENLFFFDHSALRYISIPLILPKVEIVFSGSTLVFGCASIGINIFDSTGSYGRPFRTQWRIKSISQLQFQGNYTEVVIFHALSSQLLNWNDSYAFIISKITIFNQTIELPAANYLFEVETIRWVDGKRSFSEISVSKTNDVLPTASIVGPKIVNMFIHQSLELVGTASAPCGLRPFFSFNWQITESSSSRVVLTFSGSSWTSPEYTFSHTSTYDVTLTVTSGGLQSWDKVRIVPRRSAPILNIKGGNGTFVLNSDLSLDSSASIDPDGANFEGVLFEWKCESRNNLMCNTPINFPASRVAEVLKSNLMPETLYVFSLNAIIQNTAIFSSTKVSLFVLPAGAPHVSLSRVLRKVNSEQVLRLEGMVKPAQDLIWSEVTKYNILLRSNIFPTTDSRSVIFRPNVLPSGATLKFRLSTVSSASYAEVEFVVNQAPIGGQMLVHSNLYVADIYLAKITMSGWSDEISDLPILFEFSIGLSGSLDLASASSIVSTRNIFFPSTERISIVAKISDSFGASRQISQNIVFDSAAKADMKQNGQSISVSNPIDEIMSKLADVKEGGEYGVLISFCNAISETMSKLTTNSTGVEVLRLEIISLIAGGIHSFPPLRSSQSEVVATAFANSISNASTPSSLMFVKRGVLKLLNSSLANMKPTIIEKIMTIAKLTSLSYLQTPKRMLLQDNIVMAPDAENLFVLLNFLEQILSPSLVLGQEVSRYVVSGLTFVAVVAPSESLCTKAHILEVQTATSVSISDILCFKRNETSSSVVLLSWNMQTNPYSSLSPVAVSSSVLRLNARINNGKQMNTSSLFFTFKIYKQPAAWTSMKSLAICVKWEFDVAESDGHWSAKYCQTISEDFDHLMCSCTGLSSVAITIINKDCADEPYGIPGFKMNPSACVPEEIAPIAIIAGIISAALVLGFLAVVLYRRFRLRQEFMRHHMEIQAANIEETQKSLWSADAKIERMPRKVDA
jgi:hypothetical protein